MVHFPAFFAVKGEGNFIDQGIGFGIAKATAVVGIGPPVLFWRPNGGDAPTSTQQFKIVGCPTSNCFAAIDGLNFDVDARFFGIVLNQ